MAAYPDAVERAFGADAILNDCGRVFEHRIRDKRLSEATLFFNGTGHSRLVALHLRSLEGFERLAFSN